MSHHYSWRWTISAQDHLCILRISSSNSYSFKSLKMCTKLLAKCSKIERLCIPCFIYCSFYEFHLRLILDFHSVDFLREIKFGEFRVSKSAILTHWEALNFDFHEFLHFMKAEITKLTKFRASKIMKKGQFCNSNFFWKYF